MYPNPTQEQIAECYQGLFDLLSNEHGLTLLVSDMDEIISEATNAVEKMNKLFEPSCDVDGCDQLPCNGGGCWRETGYWSVCQKHSGQWRNGESQPTMKKEAVEKEATRLPNGCLP